MHGFHPQFAVSFLTSLAIFFLSSKLVFACTGIICDDGAITNLCAIEAGRAAFSWLFYYALVVLEVGIILIWLVNKLPKLAFILVLAVMFLPFGWI
jgi:hypothetical protein